MKVSIAMATYNGERYLREQLESFLKQTRLPDELVVCDDCSTDNTVNILKDFAETAPFPVRICRNETNLGYSRNFERAIKLCKGDIIFLSDQDDVWFPKKIETVAILFQRDGSSLVIINNALLTDEQCQPTGLTIVDQIRLIGLQFDSFVHGCCTALRRTLFPLLFPIPHDFTAHDSWIHYIARILNCRQVIAKPLQYYRRHEGNTSGWIGNTAGRIKTSDLFDFAKREDPRLICTRRLETLKVVIHRLFSSETELKNLVGDDVTLAAILAPVEKELTVVKRRLDLLRRHKVLRFFLGLRMVLCGDYRRYFTGWKSFLKDLLW